MTQIIADSGSTKTDWLIIDQDRADKRFQTAGMNPSTMTDEAIAHLLQTEVAPELNNWRATSTAGGEMALTFYGAGCRPEQIDRMAGLLCQHLGCASASVHSDLLGAARALCGTAPGIVCILGTGSGSAVYDGEKFVQSTPSLGYILGDEGSGASLGKHFLANLLKGLLPPHIVAEFQQQYALDVAQVIQKTYREPAPNRFLAQFTRFVAQHRDDPAVHALIVDEFRQFFERNILNYHRPDWPINLVGSIAYHFRDELQKAAQALGLRIGKIVQSPLDEFEAQCTQAQ